MCRYQGSQQASVVSQPIARLTLWLSGLMVAFSSHASHATTASIHIGEKAAAAWEESSAEPLRYATSEDLVIRGVVGIGAPSIDANSVPLPEEVVVPAGTEFEIQDRVIDESGLGLVLISLETKDGIGSRLNLWVLESELAKSLSADSHVVMDLDEMDSATSKFYFMGETQVAGPTRLILPVKGARRTSPPGMRVHPILKVRKFHAGWDLAAPTGTPVVAAADGVVTSAGWGGGYGNLVILQHGSLQTRYAHLSKILVRGGQKVKQGQQIGKVGTTGRSTGPHLHFEKRGPGGRVLTGPITSGN